MQTINIREARMNFSKLLDSVESGEDVILMRHGKRIARITAEVQNPAAKKLPSLAEFRASLKVKGKTLRHSIQTARGLERY